MIKNKYINCIVAILMAAAVTFTVFAIKYHEPASTVTTNNSSNDFKYADLFNKDKIMTIDIKVNKSDFDTMLKNAAKEEYISCDLTLNGTTYSTVGIRPKGNSSLNTVAQDPNTDRFSFKFEFDHYVKGQTCLGLDKMVVNNIQADATYMKECLSYDLMSYMGLKTPLYSYASISVNGKPWGFYLAVEAIEESFSLGKFGYNYGMLYKPESMGNRGNGQMKDFIQDQQEDDQQDQNNQTKINGQPPMGEIGVQSPMDRMGGQGGGSDLKYIDDNIKSYSAIFDNSVFKAADTDYKRVIEALKNLNEGSDLEKYINVDEVLRYFAANTFLVNLDSYVSNLKHNYYLYEKDGQLTILPWDFNLSFAGFQAGSSESAINFPIDTPVSGIELSERPLLSKLLEVPAYNEKYHKYLNEIVGYVNGGNFKNSIKKLDALISDYVKNDASAFYTYDEYKDSLLVLKEFISLRAKSVKGQLEGTIPSTTSEQKKDSSNLIKAPSLSLQAMGTMGNGGGNMGPGNIGDQGNGGFPQNPGNMGNIDMNTMKQAMDIIRSAKGELSTEQVDELHKLGLTDEQIEQFKNMPQGMQGPGNGNFDPSQGAQGQDNENFNPGQGMQGPNNTNSLSTTYDKNYLIIIGISLISLISGLAFVFVFKRRKYRI